MVITPTPEELDVLVEQKVQLAQDRRALELREQEIQEQVAALEVLHQEQLAELEAIRQQISKDQKQLAKARQDFEKAQSNLTIRSEETAARNMLDDSLILGELEYAHVEPPGFQFEARIDSGAQTSSINAIDVKEFERDGDPYVSFYLFHPETGEKIKLTRRKLATVRIKELGSNESTSRPVIRLRTVIGNLDERIRYTLVDRSGFNQQVLIGRNFLRDMAVIDPSRKHTTTPKVTD